MRSALLFDFTVDKQTNTINVKREFAAAPALVWDAWTKAELLEKWWAPKPWHAETKSMDFKDGGHWLYAMVSPEGEKHWCKVEYQDIDAQKSFSNLNAFCDEDGNINEAFSRSFWTNTFSGDENMTAVNVDIKYKTTEDLERMVAMGFKEGFTMGLQNLEDLLEQLTK